MSDDFQPFPPAAPEAEDSLSRKELDYLSKMPAAPGLVEERQGYQADVIKIKRSFLRGARHVAYVVPFFGLGMVAVWLWHVTASVSYRWLSADEINHLQSLIFSGAISALVTAIATKAI